MFAQLFKEFIPADRFEMSFNGSSKNLLSSISCINFPLFRIAEAVINVPNNI